MSNEEKVIARWVGRMEKVLVGRQISKIRYMTDEEQDNMGWSYKAPVIELDNGDSIFPSSDDEGNDAGSLFTTFEELSVIPAI